MVIVNIRVPALEKVYNFSLDEKAAVGSIIEEVVDLVLQTEGLQSKRQKEDEGRWKGMVLCSLESGIQLAWENSLSDYGIYGGAELILV